ncbi:MAG: hypothetical protein EA351_08410 [Gemmatimonadales bacterium]|nr:MAG: hypothetical protein EA351_08410 [Gemmatimonadales bacterium]
MRHPPIPEPTMRRPDSGSIRMILTLVVVGMIHFARPAAVSAQDAGVEATPRATIQVQAVVVNPGPMQEMVGMAVRLRDAALVTHEPYLTDDSMRSVVGWLEAPGQVERLEVDRKRETPVPPARLWVADLGH